MTAPRGLDVPPAEATDRGRRPLRRVLIPALVLIPIVGAVAAYLLVFAGDAPDGLTLSTPTEQPQSQAGAPVAAAPVGGGLAGQWTVGSGSVAGYRVKEKLSRLPAESEGVGRTEAVTGGLTVRQDGDVLVAESIRLEVDVSQLKSDEAKRDDRMRTMGLETAKFPKATFAIVGPVAVPAAVASGERATVDATGELTSTA